MIRTELDSRTGAEVVRGADSLSAMGLDSGAEVGVMRLGGMDSSSVMELDGGAWVGVARRMDLQPLSLASSCILTVRHAGGMMSGMISKTGNVPVVSLNAVALDMEKGSMSASSIELKRTYSVFLKG